MRYGGQPVYDDNEDHADLSSFAYVHLSFLFCSEDCYSYHNSSQIRVILRDLSEVHLGSVVGSLRYYHLIFPTSCSFARHLYHFLFHQPRI